ncbi:MAG: DUF3099 domain-containing protein [Candidatus Planktophila sp.]
MGSDSGREQGEIYDITSAPQSLTKDLSGRQRRYFISMMIRTLCFILTVILPSPFRWFALAGAVTLPYIAVVIANAGRETITPGAALLAKKPRSLS